jgi:hypothetical protein
MTIPATANAAAIFLVLVLPGIVYGFIRAMVAGSRAHDKEWGNRVVQAILFSVVLNAIYVLIFGKALVGRVVGGAGTLTSQPRLAAAALLGLGVLVPAVLAYLRYGDLGWRSTVVLGRLSIPLPVHRTAYSTVPTAWDQVAQRLQGRWVRIRLSDGRWVGGWFDARSFISTYPEPRDIFIEDQHHIAADGTIGDLVTDSAGVWLSLKDGDVVEWLHPETPSTEKEIEACRESGRSVAAS